MSVSDAMILGQVWQRLFLLTLQPMAWVPSLPTSEAAPVKSSRLARRRAARRR